MLLRFLLRLRQVQERLGSEAGSCPMPLAGKCGYLCPMCCVPSYLAASRLSLPGDQVLGKESSLVTPKKVKVVLCWQPRGCR